MNSLKGISDRELVNRLRSLVNNEQNLTLEIIPRLVEVIRRGIHLGKGYGSLYEYCKGELGYTDASGDGSESGRPGLPFSRPHRRSTSGDRVG